MRFYRALLHLYPASFRNEYGEEMCAIHAQKLRDSAFLSSFLAIFEILYDAACVHADILRQDLKFARRTLSRSPGFALTAILVAALGIGATTAAFTMIDHVLIRPLPFAGADRLVKLYEKNTFSAMEFNDISPANYRDWKTMASSFESMGAFRGLSVNLIGQGDPQLVLGEAVTAEIFPMLGIAPALGRYFEPEDDREASPRTVVLSYDIWQKDFGADAAVLGKSITLDDAAYTIIGVMPAGFYFPGRDARLWTAMRFSARDFEDRTNTYIYGLAKLKPGVSFEQGEPEMRAISSRLSESYPKELAHIAAMPILLRDDISPASRIALKVLAAASLCVLLVACTNLANLLLARALARKKELTVRSAMGAGRERLVRQMLTESVLLASIGGIAGILLAIYSLPLLVRLVPTNLPIAAVPYVDWRILLFAGGLTIATGVVFGVVPALRVSRNSDGLREGSRSGVGGRKEKLRAALVIAEIAGSVVLLVGCGLLIRALWRVQSVDPGFRPENVLTMRTSLPMPKYDRNERREQFYERVLAEARRLPTVTSAAYTSFLPMVHGGGIWPVEIEGRPQPMSERQSASLRFITPGYFRSMGIPLRRGRDVAESDTINAPFVAVVSESFIRRYFPKEDPIGRRFDFGNAPRIIIGVAGDVRVRGLERNPEPQVYLSYKQHRDVSTWYAPKDLIVRSTSDPASLAPALRRIIRASDPELPVSDVRLLTDIVDSQTAARRVQIWALGSFAGIAFLLAAVGIHGVLSFAVSNRTQEIGVRMALGARQGDILRMIVGDGVLLAAAGVVFGSGIALGAGQTMRSLLAGVDPSDLATFATAIVLCVGMTLIGSLLPAIRAMRVDPTVAIRTE